MDFISCAIAVTQDVGRTRNRASQIKFDVTIIPYTDMNLRPMFLGSRSTSKYIILNFTIHQLDYLHHTKDAH